MASAISSALTAGATAYGFLTETVTGLLYTEKAGRRGAVFVSTGGNGRRCEGSGVGWGVGFD